MKNLLLIVALLISFQAFSQQTEEYKSFIEQIKKGGKTDKNDKTVYLLLRFL